MKKNISFGWFLIILQIIGYVGCLINNDLPTNLPQFIGFNLIGILGICIIISKNKQSKTTTNTQKIKPNSTTENVQSHDIDKTNSRFFIVMLVLAIILTSMIMIGIASS